MPNETSSSDGLIFSDDGAVVSPSINQSGHHAVFSGTEHNSKNTVQVSSNESDYINVSSRGFDRFQTALGGKPAEYDNTVNSVVEIYIEKSGITDDAEKTTLQTKLQQQYAYRELSFTEALAEYRKADTSLPIPPPHILAASLQSIYVDNCVRLEAITALKRQITDSSIVLNGLNKDNAVEKAQALLDKEVKIISKVPYESGAYSKTQKAWQTYSKSESNARDERVGRENIRPIYQMTGKDILETLAYGNDDQPGYIRAREILATKFVEKFGINSENPLNSYAGLERGVNGVLIDISAIPQNQQDWKTAHELMGLDPRKSTQVQIKRYNVFNSMANVAVKYQEMKRDTAIHLDAGFNEMSPAAQKAMLKAYGVETILVPPKQPVPRAETIPPLAPFPVQEIDLELTELDKVDILDLSDDLFLQVESIRQDRNIPLFLIYSLKDENEQLVVVKTIYTAVYSPYFKKGIELDSGVFGSDLDAINRAVKLIEPNEDQVDKMRRVLLSRDKGLEGEDFEFEDRLRLAMWEKYKSDNGITN